MKKALIAAVVLLLIAFAAYSYITGPVEAPSQSVSEVSEKLPGGSATSTVYRISQEDSLVTFNIDEMLNGKPKLVVGTTTEVGGDVGYENGKIVFGTMTINAKTFITDNANRNGAIVRLILKSDKPENEFITFKPTSDTLGAARIGEEVKGTVMGDLTISGVTKPATFDVRATVTDEEIVGVAETVVKRGDFALVIPNLSFIANVAEEVPVKVEVTAKRVMQ